MDERRTFASRSPDPPARVETARLVLRQAGPDELGAYERVVGPEAPADHREAVAHWRAHGFGPWVVESGGEAVGILEIHFAGPGVTGLAPDDVEVGWTILEERRGAGLATEAAAAAVDDAFERVEPRPGTIVAYIRPENAGSIRVAEKIGMRHVADGLTRSGGAMRIYRVGPGDRARAGGPSATIGS